MYTYQNSIQLGDNAFQYSEDTFSLYLHISISMQGKKVKSKLCKAKKKKKSPPLLLPPINLTATLKGCQSLVFPHHTTVPLFSTAEVAS